MTNDSELPGANETEAADLALRHLAVQPMTRDEALAMRGANAIESLPADHARDNT